MANERTLYHGSSMMIEQPILGKGNPNNDYGLGFYCTESLDLAKEWACSAETNGFANEYVLDESGLSVLRLTSGSYHILNWLAILLENRKFRIGSDLAQRAKDYISTTFLPSYRQYDVIVGYRADDSYFSFATSFLNNTISLAQLERAMVLGKLGEQVVPRTEKAFRQLRFVQAIPADREIYYPQKAARDTAAREEFRKEKSRQDIEHETYLVDIIREGWQDDDPRLQRVLLG